MGVASIFFLVAMGSWSLLWAGDQLLASPCGCSCLGISPGALRIWDPWCGWAGNFEPRPQRPRSLSQMASAIDLVFSYADLLDPAFPILLL